MGHLDQPPMPSVLATVGMWEAGVSKAASSLSSLHIAYTHTHTHSLLTFTLPYLYHSLSLCPLPHFPQNLPPPRWFNNIYLWRKKQSQRQSYSHPPLSHSPNDLSGWELVKPQPKARKWTQISYKWERDSGNWASQGLSQQDRLSRAARNWIQCGHPNWILNAQTPTSHRQAWVKRKPHSSKNYMSLITYLVRGGVVTYKSDSWWFLLLWALKYV